MLYCKNECEIFHVHIPRTAGRYITNIFLENNFKRYHCKYDVWFNGIEVPHLHYPLYENLEKVEECRDHFTIVRDPFERFKSIINSSVNDDGYPIEIYDKLKNKDWLFNFLFTELNMYSYHSNIFRPQTEFLSPRTKVYKFEDGMGIEFIDWINKNFNLGLERKVYKKSYPKYITETYSPKKEIDYKVKEFIKEYYEEDYARFNYE